MISMNTYYDNKCLDLNYHVKIIFKFLNRILYFLLYIFILMWDILKNYLTFKFSNINIMLHCKKIALSNLYPDNFEKSILCKKNEKQKYQGIRNKKDYFSTCSPLLKIYPCNLFFHFFFNILNIISSYVLIML